MPATKRLKLSRFTRLLILAAGAAVQSASPANAADILWPNATYSCYVDRADIKSVLTDFFASQGIGAVCSEQDKGTDRGNFADKECDDFLNYMAQAYNLIWYYDGAAVFVYSAKEITSRIINLGYLTIDRFKRDLTELEILDSRYTLRSINSERIIYVVGPQRYVELVSQMAEQLDAKAFAQRGQDDIVRVFPLKYAWAEDKTIVFRDKQVSVPGVATLLANLIAGTGPPGSRNTVPDGMSLPLNRLKGKGLAQLRYKHEENSPLDLD